MNAFSIPKFSIITLLIGASPFVVQLAFERILSFSGLYVSSLTPKTIVLSGFFAGELMRTFFAPAFRCLFASSRLANKPVDSTAK